METDSYFLTVLRYIHQNPLKAKIVKSMAESRWTSYGEYIEMPKLVDIDYALNYFSKVRLKAIPLFIEFMNAYNEDQCLDDGGKVGLTDEDVKEHLRQLGVLNPTGLQQFEKDKRDGILNKLKKIDGITKVQISRVTGISRSVVTRA